MKVVERSAIVPYLSDQMFALVNDVSRYPEFLPWCIAARSEAVAPGEVLATIKVSKGALRTEFTTRNTVDDGARILMQLVDGPFRDLRGEWRFESIADRGSRINFRLEFEFKNRLTALAMGPVFENMCGAMVEAFALRAQALYGSR